MSPTLAGPGSALLGRSCEETKAQGCGQALDHGQKTSVSVAANIATVPRLLGWDRRRIATRVAELLDLVGLGEDRYTMRYPTSSPEVSAAGWGWPGPWPPIRPFC